MTRANKLMPRHLRPKLALEKCRSGIKGLDAITGGGLPRGRPILVCGGSGTGKTLFGMEFLVRGIEESKEPGVFLCFEERAQELAANVVSLGFDLPRLIAQKKLVIDQVRIDRADITETGEYSLDGLFIRLDAAIQSIGAKRLVLDTVEALFAALTNLGILRSELGRLFDWLREKGITTIVTGERGEGTLTRHGLEEYVSDCVIVLDQRVTDQIATRRMRIVKYRGSAHGTNEYPFLIDEHGFTVLPITTIGLQYAAPTAIVSTGIAKLDAMLGHGGYFRGGTLLASGTAGTGKTSIAAHFVDAACRRGERCAYFAFEESSEQIVRNMRSIGFNLQKWVEKGLLSFFAARPATFGLETHLNAILRTVEDFKPRIVVLDPVSSFDAAGTPLDVKAMLMRVVDLLKSKQITVLMTSLSRNGQSEESVGGISSLIDTWILLRNREWSGERTRILTLIKSRGSKHSNQDRELLLTDRGIDLVDIVVGPDGAVLTGSARFAQAAADRAQAVARRQESGRVKALLLRRRKAMEAKIAEMQADLTAEALANGISTDEAASSAATLSSERVEMAQQRQRGTMSPQANGGRK